MTKAKAVTENAPAAATEPAAAPEVAAPKITTFRDKVFTSRTLVLPDNSTLPVAKGRVSVEDSNSQALAFLKAHEEFEALE